MSRESKPLKLHICAQLICKSLWKATVSSLSLIYCNTKHIFSGSMRKIARGAPVRNKKSSFRHSVLFSTEVWTLCSRFVLSVPVCVLFTFFSFSFFFLFELLFFSFFHMCCFWISTESKEFIHIREKRFLCIRSLQMPILAWCLYSTDDSGQCFPIQFALVPIR